MVGGIEKIEYRNFRKRTLKDLQKSLRVFGLDTETYPDGRCFMISTSEGDVFKPEDLPKRFFSRKYRGKAFVCYSLKFDEGSLLQGLPKEKLAELKEKGKTSWEGYIFKSFPKKALIISKGKNAVSIYDMASFFGIPLEEATSLFLGKHKLAQDTNLFTPEYVSSNWDKIAQYCIQDAILAKELAQYLISKLESLGVYPRKLFSFAYISWQHFSRKCSHSSIQRYWDFYPELLDYAMKAYRGGKFEVIEKGYDWYYEYDINSAYPFEIANLKDITSAVVLKTSRYEPKADYGFIRCRVSIPMGFHHTIGIKRGDINIYPAGEFEAIITKAEFDFLRENKIPVRILDAYWLKCQSERYPYREEILRLYQEKLLAKAEGRLVEYHILKMLLNSLYGKFLQLISKGDKFIAGSSWNPIYGAIITANIRLRLAKMQNQYDSIVAVHTDSIIATNPLPIDNSKEIGEFSKAIEGEGVILGSGVYQIGEKSKFRGFETKVKLLDLVRHAKGKKIKIDIYRPLTWREVLHYNWDVNLINRFTKISKEIEVNFDIKRLWIDDWKNFSEVLKRKVDSVQLIYSDLLGF